MFEDVVETKPFKPIPIAEMRNVAKEQGFEQAYNILLIGGYGFIEGTVKDYDEYEGIKQTILTRCKLVL
mgnify:CR=1 FL=1